MFTIKLYSGGRQLILSADHFTILRGDPRQGDSSQSADVAPAIAEITLHQKNGENDRYDIGEGYPPAPPPRPGQMPSGERWPPRYQRAIIENAAGKTTEMIELRPI